MKILIAIPTYENILPDTFKSVWDMDKCGHECLFEFVRGYDVSTARNNIAIKAMDIESDYVLMVDNDVVVPKDTLKCFLEDVKPVQLGNYYHRPKINASDDRVVLFKNDEEGWTHQYKDYEFLDIKENKVQVHGGGMGCALIKTSVFEQLAFPYFHWFQFTHDKSKRLSEDLYFCNQCKGHDIPIFADTRVKCGHAIRYVKYL